MIGLTPVTSILPRVKKEMIPLIVPASLIRNIAPILMASTLHQDTNSVILRLLANHTSGYLPALQFPPESWLARRFSFMSLVADVFILLTNTLQTIGPTILSVHNPSMRRVIMTGLKIRSLAVVLMLVLVLTTSSVWAADQEAKVVSTQWLQDNLSRSDIRIVDVRNSVADYWQSHIPGAVYMNPEVMRLADRGVPVKLLPPEALVIMLGKMGIDPKTMVVVYTESGDFKGPYLVWALDYLGHKQVAVMEGGFSKWQKDGFLVTQDYPEISVKEYPQPKMLHHEVRASLDEVKKVVVSGGAIIIDVRPVELYTGEKGPWKRKGHIKGSLSRFWGEDLAAGGMWKNRVELKAAYEKLGVTPDKQIITSCGQGQMSAHTYFTLKYLLNYPNVRNYDGSFNEWSNIMDLPVETGMTP